jgi:hypothetical protein
MEKGTADTAEAGNVEAPAPTTIYIYIYIYIERERERKLLVDGDKLD